MPSFYTNLAELLAPYFHQGWSAEGATLDDVVSHIARDTPPELLRAGLTELDQLIGSDLCEPQLQDVVLYELDCHIDPALVGLDYSTWLLHLHDRLRRTG